jgi:predicted dienelactone hydrolase
MSRLTRRATCAALLSAVFAPAWAQDTAALSVHELEWADASRQRSVPVRLYLPAGAAGVGIERVPLVVFSHGIGGSRAGYSYLGRHFASQGVASLHLQHVGSDRSLWLGNPLSLVGRLHDAAQDSEAIARVQDLRFALDRLLAHDLGSRIDAARIVAAGHSYGANTTLLAAGARVERQGQVLDFRDPRVKAAILISAPPFYGETDPSKILAHVTVPSLHITATEDIIRIPGYVSGAEDRVAVFDAVAGSRKTLAVFAGGSHSVFTDRAATGGAALNPQIKTATKELSLAFVRSVFDGDEGPLRAWPQRFGALVHRFASPSLN